VSGVVLRRELERVLARRPLLAVKLGFPLVVGIPLLLSGAPAFDQAMALGLLVPVVGALGSGAVLCRERAAGLLLRDRLLAVPPRLVALERIGAASLVDLVQLAPVLALACALHLQVRWWPALWLAAAASLVAANLLGALATTVASSPGEVMVLTLLPLLPALYASGVFVPLTGPGQVVERALPFAYLQQALAGVLGAPAALLWATPLQAALGGLAWLGAALGGAVLAGRRVVEA
jgi:hypothetical protein